MELTPTGPPKIKGGSGEPPLIFWCLLQSFLGIWGASAVGLKLCISPLGCIGVTSFFSYGSVSTTGRAPSLPVVCKGRGYPSPYFGGPLRSFWGGWGSSAVGLKLCISPLGCTGGSGKSCWSVPLWDSVSGSPVCWGVRSIPSPNIFLGLVQYGVHFS